MSCGIRTSATFKIAAIKEQITAEEEQIAEHHKNIEALKVEVKTLRDEEKVEEEIRTGKKQKFLAWLEGVRPPPSICSRMY
jgi:cell division protein FtsL